MEQLQRKLRCAVRSLRAMVPLVSLKDADLVSWARGSWLGEAASGMDHPSDVVTGVNVTKKRQCLSYVIKILNIPELQEKFGGTKLDIHLWKILEPK